MEISFRKKGWKWKKQTIYRTIVKQVVVTLILFEKKKKCLKSQLNLIKMFYSIELRDDVPTLAAFYELNTETRCFWERRKQEANDKFYRLIAN